MFALCGEEAPSQVLLGMFPASRLRGDWAQAVAIAAWERNSHVRNFLGARPSRRLDRRSKPRILGIYSHRPHVIASWSTRCPLSPSTRSSPSQCFSFASPCIGRFALRLDGSRRKLTNWTHRMRNRSQFHAGTHQVCSSLNQGALLAAAAGDLCARDGVDTYRAEPCRAPTTNTPAPMPGRMDIARSSNRLTA